MQNLQVKAKVMGETEVNRTITRITHEILESNQGTENLALIGIVTRGYSIAEIIVDKIKEIEGVEVPLGLLDISFYRDDFHTNLSPTLHQSKIDFTVDGSNIVLVDDILYTGRTVRAALDAIMDYGRPQTVKLAVLVDRGHRELPIRADFVGKNVPSSRSEHVKFFIEKIDGFTEVQILEKIHTEG